MAKPKVKPALTEVANVRLPHVKETKNMRRFEVDREEGLPVHNIYVDKGVLPAGFEGTVTVIVLIDE